MDSTFQVPAWFNVQAESEEDAVWLVRNCTATPTYFSKYVTREIGQPVKIGENA